MRTIRPAAILMLVALGGCATTKPDHSLQALQNDMVRRLAADCYRQHEGERTIYGSPQVWLSCRTWASRQVQVRLPQ
jgi:hypothetical protein